MPNKAFNADSLQRGICSANFTPRCKSLRRQAGSVLPVNLALGSSMSAPIEISLSQDQALVIYELLARFQETNALCLKNNAEFLALSAIGAQLDKLLVQPLEANYAQILHEAQQRLQVGFDGIAPGESPLVSGRLHGLSAGDFCLLRRC